MTHEHPYIEEAALLYTSTMIVEISKGHCCSYQYLCLMHSTKSAAKKNNLCALTTSFCPLHQTSTKILNLSNLTSSGKTPTIIQKYLT
jgi:hypothetical protein